MERVQVRASDKGPGCHGNPTLLCVPYLRKLWGLICVLHVTFGMISDSCLFIFTVFCIWLLWNSGIIKKHNIRNRDLSHRPHPAFQDSAWLCSEFTPGSAWEIIHGCQESNQSWPCGEQARDPCTVSLALSWSLWYKKEKQPEAGLCSILLFLTDFFFKSLRDFKYSVVHWSQSKFYYLLLNKALEWRKRMKFMTFEVIYHLLYSEAFWMCSVLSVSEWYSGKKNPLESSVDEYIFKLYIHYLFTI